MARLDSVFSRGWWLPIAVVCVVLASLLWPLRSRLQPGTRPQAAPQNQIAWRANIGAALAESRSTGKPVFADFNATWCAPCLAMQRDVWPNPEVKRTLESSFIPVAIDVDKDSATADKYRVDGIPTILLLDGEGQVLRRAGYLPLEGMLRFLYEAGR